MTQKPKRTFYGHGFPTIGINLFMALIAPFFMYGILKEIQSEHSCIAIVFQLGEFLVYGPFVLASTSYLCFEMKHVLFQDGIADSSMVGKLAFFIMSIIGYLSGVVTIQIIVDTLPYLHNASMVLEVIALSFVSAFGGAMGLRDNVPTDMFLYPKTFLEDVLQILTGKLLLLVLFMAILLSVGVWAESQMVTIP